MLGALSRRSMLQEEGLCYEQKRHHGSMPLPSVNVFLVKDHARQFATTVELIPSSEPDKAAQIAGVRTVQLARNSLAL